MHLLELADDLEVIVDAPNDHAITLEHLGAQRELANPHVAAEPDNEVNVTGEYGRALTRSQGFSLSQAVKAQVLGRLKRLMQSRAAKVPSEAPHDMGQLQRANTTRVKELL